MKVLVVEAEDAVLKATGVMLNKLGYEVGLAPNCKEALQIYSDKGPHDIVVIALKFLRSSQCRRRQIYGCPASRRIPNKSSRLSRHRRF
jgi:CheY-like chemotaxis protein